MLVSGSVKTDKYVSLTNLRDYVFLTPSSSFTPYTSAFKTFYRGADSGNTKNHHLTHQQAQGYNFTFHPSSEYPAVSKSAKLCLPEEMIALNPKILFGGVVSSGGSIGTASVNLSENDNIDIGFVAFVTFADRVTVKIISYSSYLAGGGSGNISLLGKFTNIDYSINGSTVTLADVKSHGEIESVRWDTVNAFQHTGTVNWQLNSSHFTGYGSMYLTKSPSTPSSTTRKKKWNFGTTGTTYSAEGTVVTCNDIKDFNKSGESTSNFYLYLSPEPVGTLTLTQSGFQFPWYVRLEYGATNVQHPAYTATFSLLGTGSTALDTQTVTLSANMNAQSASKSVTVPNSLANTNIRFSVSSISPTPPYGYTTYAEKNNSTVTNMTFTAATQSAYTSVVNITYESPEFSMRIQTRGGFESGSPGAYDTFHDVDVSRIGYDRSDVFSESATFSGTVVDNYFVYGSYVDITATTNETLYFTFPNAIDGGWKEVGIFDGDDNVLVTPVEREGMGYTGRFLWQVSGRPSVIYIDFDFRD